MVLSDMPPDGEEEDRKPAASESLPRNGAHTTATDNSEGNGAAVDEGLTRVVGDYFAIEKVVGWRGEGRAREYKIKWEGSTKEDWVKKNDLCRDSNMEGEALVRADKKRQKALEKERTGASDDTPKSQQKPKKPSTATRKRKKPHPATAVLVSKISNEPSKVGDLVSENGSRRHDKYIDVDLSEDSSPKWETSVADDFERVIPVRQSQAQNQGAWVMDMCVTEHWEPMGSEGASFCYTSSSVNEQGRERELDKKSIQSNPEQSHEKAPKKELVQADLEQSHQKEPKKKAKRKRPKKDAKRAKDDGATSRMSPEERIRLELARGNDVELVDFQPVVRIDVKEENARGRVSDARKNGIPIVLTGHLGWPQFAARWLKDVSESEPLDLSQTHELNIENMIRDIGEEEVPIVEKNYDEKDPTASAIKASIFLEKHWPRKGETQDCKKKLYMQQWQFPYSKKAEKILCGPDRCSPPPGVFYEDLLQFWLDEGVNPYQYLFMGDAGTMSKLHKDPGGLDILISPIVGEKECILAHRLDNFYLYNLNSKLDEIDLHQCPLTAFSSVWKTTIRPGEILVMPHDTYHQCRNVTPCLSYHRLHLDAINLRGFLESMFTGDAEDMEHTEVLWNTGSELMNRVEDFLEKYRTKDHHNNDGLDPQNLEHEKIAETVKVLRLLRCAFLGLARSLEDPQAPERKWLTYTPENWKTLVGDIGGTLHDYRYRDDQQVPRYRRPNLDTSIAIAAESDDSDDSSDEDEKQEYAGKWHLDSVHQTLESWMETLPYLQPNENDLVIYDSISLRVGDEIHIRLNKRRAQGTVKKVTNMTALRVTYDDLPSSFDEYQPRNQVHGRTDTFRGAVPSALRPSQGMQHIVRCVPSGDATKVSFQFCDSLCSTCTSRRNGIRVWLNSLFYVTATSTGYNHHLEDGYFLPNRIQDRRLWQDYPKMDVSGHFHSKSCLVAMQRHPFARWSRFLKFFNTMVYVLHYSLFIVVDFFFYAMRN